MFLDGREQNKRQYNCKETEKVKKEVNYSHIKVRNILQERNILFQILCFFSFLTPNLNDNSQSRTQ